MAISLVSFSAVEPVAKVGGWQKAGYVNCAGNTKWVGRCPIGYEYVPQGLIFSENFDAQPDWYSPASGDTGNGFFSALPSGWDAGRTSESWHPDNGYPNTQPVMQINGNNPDQVYGGTGKAFIFYGESYDENNWNSDGFLIKDIEPTKEVYVKLKIKFQTGFADDTGRGQIKIFRMLSWDAPESGDRTPFFSDGYSSPIYIWDWAQTDYGLRNQHAFRCDAQEDNYYCQDPLILNPPRSITSGSMSANYTDTPAYLNPQIPDLVNGGFLPSSGNVFHNQVYGDVWHTVEIYLKQNSALGVQDGEMRYWLDGQPIIDMGGIPWIGPTGSMDAKWNSFSIGGNNFYKFDLVGDPVDRERWYAIDNIEVYNTLPEHLQ